MFGSRSLLEMVGIEETERCARRWHFANSAQDQRKFDYHKDVVERHWGMTME